MAIWKRYSLGITLFVLFAAAWIIMTLVDWVYFGGQQQEHHQTAEVFGSSGYIWQWGLDTFSNWQADFLGMGLGVLLGAYLIFRGSEESKDSSDEVQSIVQDIERQVRGAEAAEQAQRATRAQVYRGGWFRNYGLAYVLLGGFIVSWILMTWMGWMHFAENAREHGESPEVFGTSGYIWEWARETLENWQADFLGHAALVIVPAYLLYKGSSQSRESMDRVGAAVRRVQQAVAGRGQQGQTEDSSLYVETRPIQDTAQPLPFWKKYGLGITVLGAFLVTWVLQTWTGWGYFVSEQLQHHQPAEVFGPSGYIWQWGEDTFSNWQSDLLWAGITIVLSAYLIYRGSAESKDSDEKMEDLAFSIERQVRGEDGAQQAQRRTDRHVFDDVWHNRGLAFSLIAAGIASWVLMTWMGWMNFASSEQVHGTAATVFGSSGYIWDWARLTLENWQSDLLGDLALVVLSAYLLYRGSGISRGSDDEIEQSLQRIHQALEEKQQPRAGGEVRTTERT